MEAGEVKVPSTRRMISDIAYMPEGRKKRLFKVVGDEYFAEGFTDDTKSNKPRGDT